MKRLLLVFAIATGLVMAGFATQAWAQAQVGNFHITFNSIMGSPYGHPDVDDGWENPFTGERWTFYPNAPGNPWWNQWWYDDPPNPLRWKEIFYDITIESWPFDPTNPPPNSDQVLVAINWSNMQYPETGPLGTFPSPEEEWAIEREVIFNGMLAAGDVQNLSDRFIIPDYNPEWVSIDVWVEYGNPEPVNRIEIFGSFTHECIPEPATAGLLMLGVMGMLLRRRDR